MTGSASPSVNASGATAVAASAIATSAVVATAEVPAMPVIEAESFLGRTDNVVDLHERRRDEGVLAPEAWHTLVEQLGLTGPALNFARNCALERAEGALWVFALSPGHQMLSQPGHLARLEEQLSRHTGSGVKVRVDVRESVQESPAGRVQRLRREAGQKAEAAFRDDGFVQALVREFDAVIETQSIRPL
jgi:DNA polymerase-3 subunit gamma/tau